MQAIFRTIIQDGRPNLPPDQANEGIYLCHSDGDGFSTRYQNEDGTVEVWVQSTDEVIQYMKDNQVDYTWIEDIVEGV